MAAVVLLAPACSSDLRGPSVDDPRACAHSNVELDEVTEHFAIQLPSSAANVRYASDLHPLFGEYTLEMTFSMSPGDLEHFLDESGFPPLRRQRDFFGFNACPRAQYMNRPMGAQHEVQTGVVELVVLDQTLERVEVAVAGYDL